nr:hypothetical protein CFP56_20833 [Quercus suber]
MSRFRSSTDDLAYGDIPQRWDRDRFERLSRPPPPRGFDEHEEYRYVERDRPGRRDVAVADRIDERGPGGYRYDERDRFVEEDRYAPPGRPRRRTDRELFGDVDPRELAGMALAPYRGKSSVPEDIDIERRYSPRPGLLRRQSSLDTFDRKSSRRPEREEYRIPANVPVPLPIRRVRNEYDDYRGRGFEPESYREIEIQRERSIHRNGSRPPKSEISESDAQTVKSSKSKKSKKSKAPTTVVSSSSSSSTETVEEIEKELSIHESIGPAGSVHDSIRESIHDTTKKFKKGKTRMPKRLVRREAIMDLGYPFDEEQDFYILRIALEKEQIDEVIKISETYKNGGRWWNSLAVVLYIWTDHITEKSEKKIYRFEENSEEIAIPPPPVGEREEIIRTEWRNPPTIRGASPSAHSTTTRPASPARTLHTHRSSRSRARSRAHSRATSRPASFYEERRTVVEESGPPPAPAPPLAPEPGGEFYESRTIIEERSPNSSGALITQERDHRSDRDINAEIRALEAERRALRLEREAEDKRDQALRLREHRDDEEFQLVEYRRPARETKPENPRRCARDADLIPGNVCSTGRALNCWRCFFDHVGSKAGREAFSGMEVLCYSTLMTKRERSMLDIMSFIENLRTYDTSF